MTHSTTQPPRADAPGRADACPNCGTATPGRFCPACGQRQDTLRQPAWLFAREAAVEFAGVDGRLWRTLGALLFVPGELTRAHFEGQRMRYIRPLRLYLVSTLGFFFLLSLLDPYARLRSGVAAELVAERAPATAAALRDSLERELAALRLAEERLAGERPDTSRVAEDGTTGGAGVTAVPGVSDSLLGDVSGLRFAPGGLDARRIARGETTLRAQLALLRDAAPDSLVAPGAYETAARLVAEGPSSGETSGLPAWLPRGPALQRLLGASTDRERIDAGIELARLSVGRIPTVMFVLLPVFALLLRILYVRRGWFYSEHVVFSLHTHATAFVVFAACALVLATGEPWADRAALALALMLPLYFLVALKRVYGQEWGKTLAKALVLGWVYAFALIAGLTAAVLVAAVWG